MLPFSEGEVIRQSQQGSPVRVGLTEDRSILLGLFSVLWRAPHSVPDRALGGKLRGVGNQPTSVLSAKWLYHLLALESWGEDSSRCFEKPKPLDVKMQDRLFMTQTW